MHTSTKKLLGKDPNKMFVASRMLLNISKTENVTKWETTDVLCNESTQAVALQACSGFVSMFLHTYTTSDCFVNYC